jgi:predicted amidophosphoribosyltransferase
MCVLDLLLPQRCLVCAVPGGQVCDACRSALPRIEPPLCERCGAPTAWPVRRCAECTGRRLAFARARAALEYDEPLRRIVAAWKERGLRRLAGWAAGIVVEAVPRPEVTCLAFVPSDPDRRLQRGHHAAERLARELGKAWELPVESLLARSPGSPRQRGLSRAHRRRNVASAFTPAGRAPTGVALIDDVYTTGATVNSAASALRATDAKRVEVITFARAIRIR